MDSSQDRLRFAMATHGISVSRLARMIGVKRQTVHMWLRVGLDHADAVRFILLCDILGIRARWILHGKGMMDVMGDQPDMRPEHAVTLFDTLRPEALELWIRVGVMFSHLSNGNDS